jgi:hypothetical protein
METSSLLAVAVVSLSPSHQPFPDVHRQIDGSCFDAPQPKNDNLKRLLKIVIFYLEINHFNLIVFSV